VNYGLSLPRHCSSEPRLTRAWLEWYQAIPRGRDFRFVPVGGFGLHLGPYI